jgi:glycosyltransferase involved in cell wall biosynthesis
MEQGWIDAVIPVSSIERDREKIKNIVQNVSANINLIFVLDMDAKDEFQAREYLNKILSEFNSKAVLISSNPKNPGSARNLGLTRATARYVVFWDSDDEPNQPEISRAVDERRSKAIEFDILVGNYEIVEKMTITRKLLQSNSIPLELARDTGLWRMVFKREFIQNIKFPDLTMAEDQIFFLRVFMKNPIIGSSHTIFYRYFKGGRNQLTYSKDAFGDLPLAMKVTSSMRNQCDTTQKDLILHTFFLRQAVSGLKNGNLKTKILVLITFVKETNVRELKIFAGILARIARGRFQRPLDWDNDE